MINWKISDGDMKLAVDIAARASSTNTKLDYRETLMDIVAVHVNGNPLRLTELASADRFNFMHDVYGIARHLNRETGKLEDCFSPRFSKRAERMGA